MVYIAIIKYFSITCRVFSQVQDMIHLEMQFILLFQLFVQGTYMGSIGIQLYGNTCVTIK